MTKKLLQINVLLIKYEFSFEHKLAKQKVPRFECTKRHFFQSWLKEIKKGIICSVNKFSRRKFTLGKYIFKIN